MYLNAQRRPVSRRSFIKTGCVAAGSAALGIRCSPVGEAHTGRIMTVQGPVDPSSMGMTLAHEHVLVDFIGAAEVSPDRYDVDEAYGVIYPHLTKARDLGCRTLVECTPAYLGRDPLLLKRLSAATNVHLLTNTGYYGAADDRFVPGHAYGESADTLADRWIREWEDGIDGTGVRPGFIKIGVDKTSLSEIDAKLVRAAARTHLRTGLTIYSHTGYAIPAREEVAILREEGVHPSAWVWTHAQNETDNDAHEEVARAGGWIAFDGCREDSWAKHLAHLLAMKKRGLLERVHLSHDGGWYRPGEPGGGKFTPYSFIFETFLDRMRASRFMDGEIEQIMLKNPAKTLKVGVRKA